ncbi:putative DNA modification/repair radical SAM protein [Paracraurococcus lichenis]|uniref:DNA modification/repair radical SAM protein n=1 Tax=Paracraurococcus lichenis TaxID=3064888 RepID=A0ABT9DZA6_9PROT|nr:putative DNA modification/repair radical SAM protein [Paracraurococcus sp. LOR1-02]MDO9709239.1 putative DNA modification/repair radical SAM protein [Paracraurococcus sp. LOR1-02]
MDLRHKLEILADAAKYDASCASSGTEKRDSRKGGIGSTEGMGICHAYAPDGRCISLLKVLLTNACVFDCAYCINRASSNVPRARFTVKELVELTLHFYRRNYIEGLFLSSGIIRSPDYTMEQIVEVARLLREEHGFQGYIHLKTIPDAAPELLARAGLYADRLSINIELPQERSLKSLAPEKDAPGIRRAMARMRLCIEEAKEARRAERRAAAPRFAPAGQSTQMIVGADAADDRAVLGTSANLYAGYGLRRVYYSAYSPIPDASSLLPPAAPPLVREHRLYQADWLLRFYGFELDEILAGGEGGMLDLGIDPKLAWALKLRDRFPVDVNRAPREMLLRVPGLGAKTVDRLLSARRHRSIRSDDLARLRLPLGKLLPFLVTADHRPRGGLLDRTDLRARLAPQTAFAARARPQQLALL